MDFNHFGDFVKSISEAPDHAVFEALDRKYKLLQDDLNRHPSHFTDEAFSILYFMLFVRAAKHGHLIRCIVPLLEDHMEFYKKTVARLVKTGELPPAVLSQFDKTFMASALD